MTAAQIFSVANTAVLPGWLLLICAPRWRYTQTIAGCVLPLALSVTYVAVLALHWGKSSGGFNSLAAVSQLFANPWLLLGGWIHYLAFDLFIGAWELRDGQTRGLSHWLLIPCLLLTFLFGPAGLLLFHLLRRPLSKN